MIATTKPRKPRRESEPAADLPAVPEGGYAFEDDGKQITWRLDGRPSAWRQSRQHRRRHRQ